MKLTKNLSKFIETYFIFSKTILLPTFLQSKFDIKGGNVLCFMTTVKLIWYENWIVINNN